MNFKNVKIDIDLSKKNALKNFPDFFIVGPQRTGTTWLSRCLEKHPAIFLHRQKELYFFNLLNFQKHSLFKSDKLSWYLSCFKETPKQLLKKNYEAILNFKMLYNPIIKGESTASYAALVPEVISEVVQLNPNIKIIVSIRDIVERAWSHAKHDFIPKGSKNNIKNISDEKLIEYFQSEYIRKCSDYRSNIQNWKKVLKEGNLKLIFFKEINENPEGVLLDVYSFLGVKSDRKLIPQEAYKVINPTQKSAVPERFHKVLSDLYKEEINWLKEQFGDRV